MAKATVGNLVKKAFVKNAKHGASAANLYTGKKLNSVVLGGALAVGTVSAMGGVDSFGSQNLTTEQGTDLGNLMGPGIQNTLATRMGTAEQATAPSILAGAREHQTKSQAPTLGAKGDMVFGMHNKRKG